MLYRDTFAKYIEGYGGVGHVRVYLTMILFFIKVSKPIVIFLLVIDKKNYFTVDKLSNRLVSGLDMILDQILELFYDLPDTEFPIT